MHIGVFMDEEQYREWQQYNCARCLSHRSCDIQRELAQREGVVDIDIAEKCGYFTSEKQQWQCPSLQNML